MLNVRINDIIFITINDTSFKEFSMDKILILSVSFFNSGEN